LKEIYREEHKMAISDEQAYEILSGVMRFLYLTRIHPWKELPVQREAPDQGSEAEPESVPLVSDCHQHSTPNQS
jgi:hypothetical protein